MIKVALIPRLEATAEPTLLLGLSKLNCARLLNGLPIDVNAHHVDPRLPIMRVILLGGDDEKTLLDDLQAAFARVEDQPTPGQEAPRG